MLAATIPSIIFGKPIAFGRSFVALSLKQDAIIEYFAELSVIIFSTSSQSILSFSPSRPSSLPCPIIIST